MPVVNFAAKREATVWEQVELAPGESFEIQILKPKYKDLIEDLDTVGPVAAKRLKLLCGWRGITQPGETPESPPAPVQFSFSVFEQLCEMFPDLPLRVAVAINKLFQNPIDPKK